MSSSCIEEVSVPDDNWSLASVSELLGRAGITINGSSPSDPQVKHPDFFKRVLREGSLAWGKVIWTAGGSVNGWICFSPAFYAPVWKTSSPAI